MLVRSIQGFGFENKDYFDYSALISRNLTTEATENAQRTLSPLI